MRDIDFNKSKKKKKKKKERIILYNPKVSIRKSFLQQSPLAYSLYTVIELIALKKSLFLERASIFQLKLQTALTCVSFL